MSFKVYSIPLFDKQAKRLAKKYPSLKSDLNGLIDRLTADPMQGSQLGNNFYKVRLAITSKGRGKSGGARVVTYVKVVDSRVFLTYIYDKSEKAAITEAELNRLFNFVK